MRFPLALALACLAWSAGAEARFMPRPRRVPDVCPAFASWDEALACLKLFGTPKELRSVPHARLVEVTRPGGVRVGRYFFMQSGAEWTFMAEIDLDADVARIESVKLGTRWGYRLDIDEVKPSFLTFEDHSVVASMRYTHSELYCSGDTRYRCGEAVVACDEIVRGKALFSFRGRAVIEGSLLRVEGDRAKAGQCAPSPEEPRLWEP